MKTKWIGVVIGLALALVSGCDPNSSRSLLRPTGEPLGISVLRGRIDFGTGSFPQTLCLLARVKDPNFRSSNTSIRVAGTLTEPQWTIDVSPRLTQLAPGVWVDTLRLKSGEFRWKFVTNDNWESPYDYGSLDGSRPDGLENDLGLSTGGGSPGLLASVPADFANRVLVCVVDEARATPHYKFARIEQSTAAYTSTTDGSFSIAGLVAGSYVLEIRPPGRAASRVSVTVGDGITDLGSISLAGGGLRGALEWDPTLMPDLASPPYPPTRVELWSGATLVSSATTSRATRTFEFTGISAGSYRIVADARLFQSTTRDTIAVGGFIRDIGTVTLPFSLDELPSQMNLAGDFNGFPPEPFPDSTAMDQIALGVWVYPNSGFPAQTIAAGTYNMKFVTDGAFDNPTDYGGSETVTLMVPITNAETQLVAGLGTAIRVQFPSNGRYRFTLDERRQVFSIEPITATSAVARHRR